MASNQADRSNIVSATERKPRLVARFVDSSADIERAQRMRYEIFHEEFGAQFHTLSADGSMLIDADDYDAHCLHLVVEDQSTGHLIGYTRLLPDHAAKQLGGFYSAHEFSLDNLLSKPGRYLEIGRTCIHPEHRNGATITVLWSKVAEYLLQGGFDYLIGCASVPLSDGGKALAKMMPELREKYLSDGHLRVAPRIPYLTSAHSADSEVRMPPLLKAYVRMGAKICGEPCWDRDFNTADLFILLDVHRDLSDRYARRFLDRARA